MISKIKSLCLKSCQIFTDILMGSELHKYTTKDNLEDYSWDWDIKYLENTKYGMFIVYSIFPYCKGIEWPDNLQKDRNSRYIFAYKVSLNLNLIWWNNPVNSTWNLAAKKGSTCEAVQESKSDGGHSH